jgi:hypothetical protein
MIAVPNNLQYDANLTFSVKNSRLANLKIKRIILHNLLGYIVHYLKILGMFIQQTALKSIFARINFKTYSFMQFYQLVITEKKCGTKNQYFFL